MYKKEGGKKGDEGKGERGKGSHMLLSTNQNRGRGKKHFHIQAGAAAVLNFKKGGRERKGRHWLQEEDDKKGEKKKIPDTVE